MVLLHILVDFAYLLTVSKTQHVLLQAQYQQASYSDTRVKQYYKFHKMLLHIM